MTQKQHDKHIADNQAEQKRMLEGTETQDAGPTFDGLGKWEGGRAALLGSNRWVLEKEHAQRTGDGKNRPGIDYPSKITQLNQKDFSEIRMAADKVMLYNVKTDAWDIEGTTEDLPFYRDANGKLWAFNWKNAKWDVEVEEVHQQSIEQRTDDGDTISQALAEGTK